MRGQNQKKGPLRASAADRERSERKQTRFDRGDKKNGEKRFGNVADKSCFERNTDIRGRSTDSRKVRFDTEKEESAAPISTPKKKKIPGQVCRVEKKCGGCQLLHLTYEEQLKKKQKQVSILMKPYCTVHKIKGMESPLHYRNKVHAVFTHKRDGQIVSGIYEEGTHNVIPVDECLLEDQKADAIIRDIRDLLKSFKIKTYNEDTGYGLFRHVLVRVGHVTRQVMVVLVLGSPILPSKNNFVKALLKLHPEITTIVLNVNDKKTSMVLGDRETVLYGKGYIEDELCGRRFRISPKSFYQINSVQTEKLYAKAMELAGLSGKERVVDAYCGIGTIGLIASAKAKEVIGVELNGDAVKDAVRNAKMNDVTNTRFYENDAGVFMTEMAAAGESADVVFMDPPRAGSDEAFLSSVVTLAPKKIVYISCNPQTQARDVAYLRKHGYQAGGCWPYDLFPMTGHVETVCLLVRTNGLHIDIDVDVEEMLQEKRGQATYAQIKDYVLEQNGFKVSSLYISQVKRKCGLDVSDSYNKPKSEDAIVPQCPPEKEEAIMNALRHFGVI